MGGVCASGPSWRAAGRRLRVPAVMLAAALAAIGLPMAPAARAGASAAAPAQVPPLTVTVSQTTGLSPGQVVDVTIDGPVGHTYILALCPDQLPDSCRDLRYEEADHSPFTVQTAVDNWFISSIAPVAVYCGACYINVFDLDAGAWASVAIEVDPGPPTFEFLYDYPYNGRAPTLLATGDVLDGAVSGVRPVDTSLALCSADVLATHDVAGGPCTAHQVVPAGDGPERPHVTVAKEFTGADGQPVDCRYDGCVVALGSADGSIFLSLPVTFTHFAAVPATGLADGQQVAVEGAGLLPTYQGPPFWIFPVTGTWTLGLCDAAVLDAPSIYSVFLHCTNVEGVGEVVVPGSGPVDLGPATVRSSFTSILGEEVDCAAGPGACVLTLLRVESTGATTAKGAPLAFA